VAISLQFGSAIYTIPDCFSATAHYQPFGLPNTEKILLFSEKISLWFLSEIGHYALGARAFLTRISSFCHFIMPINPFELPVSNTFASIEDTLLPSELDGHDGKNRAAINHLQITCKSPPRTILMLSKYGLPLTLKRNRPSIVTVRRQNDYCWVDYSAKKTNFVFNP
jgi:hypothetical protein